MGVTLKINVPADIVERGKQFGHRPVRLAEMYLFHDRITEVSGVDSDFWDIYRRTPDDMMGKLLRPDSEYDDERD